MICLSAGEWVKHYRRRKAKFLRLAQEEKADELEQEPEYSARGYHRVVPYDKSTVTYIPSETHPGQFERVRIPLVSGNPLGGDVNWNVPGMGLEFRRPNPKKSPSSAEEWQRLFEEGRVSDEPIEEQHLPSGFYGSPEGGKQFLGHAISDLAYPEEDQEGEYWLIDPSLRPEEVSGRYPAQEEQATAKYKAANDWLETLMIGLSHLSDENWTQGGLSAQDIMDICRTGTMTDRMEREKPAIKYIDEKTSQEKAFGQEDFITLAYNTAERAIRNVVENHSYVNEGQAQLINTTKVVLRALSKVLGPHYMSSTGTPPWGYFMSMVKATAEEEANKLAARNIDTESIDEMRFDDTGAPGIGTIDKLIADVMTAETESDAQNRIQEDREDNIALVEQRNPDLIQELNQNFGRFLASGQIQLSQWVREALPQLFSENGPVIDISNPNIIPENWCPNCGQHSIDFEGNRAVCQNPECHNNLTIGRAPGDYDIDQPFNVGQETYQQLRSMIYRPLLAYLETERHNPNHSADERRDIARLMTGIPVGMIHEGRQMSPSSTHEARWGGYTIPVGNDIRIFPAALGKKDSKKKQELSMYSQGIPLGGIVDGVSSSDLGKESPWGAIGGGGYSPPEETQKKGIMDLVTHPSEMAMDVAQDIKMDNPFWENAIDEADVNIEEGSKAKSDRKKRKIQQYQQSLAAHAMMLFDPTILNMLGEEDVYAPEVIKHVSNSAVAYANLMEKYYGFDPQDIHQDLLETFDFLRRHANAEVEIDSDDISNDWLQFVIQSGWQYSMNEDELRENLKNAIAQDQAADEPTKNQIQKAEDEAKKIIDKLGHIQTLMGKMNSTINAIHDKQFDLGLHIMDSVDGEVSTLYEALGGGMSENLFPRSRTRPFAIGEDTPHDMLQLEYGERKNEMDFREDVAIGMTGLFGFGNDYNGHPGQLTSPISKGNKNFSIDMEATLPDGYHQMFIGDDTFTVSKTSGEGGVVWAVYDASQLSEAEYPAGTDILVDEYIPDRERGGSGGGGGGTTVHYRTSEYYSPEAIADRWNTSPDVVRTVIDSLLVRSTQRILGQIDTNNTTPGSIATIKSFFTAMLPASLHQIFIRNAYDRTKDQDEFNPNAQDPTGRAVQFIHDISAWDQQGRKPQGEKVLNEKYPDVPDDIKQRILQELEASWGPSHRTAEIVKTYYPLAQRLWMTPISVPENREKRRELFATPKNDGEVVGWMGPVGIKSPYWLMIANPV